MGENFQVYRAAVNAAKGIRQFQKADIEIGKDKTDSAVRHYDKGDTDGASKRYEEALEHYDTALDTLDG